MGLRLRRSGCRVLFVRGQARGELWVWIFGLFGSGLLCLFLALWSCLRARPRKGGPDVLNLANGKGRNILHRKEMMYCGRQQLMELNCLEMTQKKSRWVVLGKRKGGCRRRVGKEEVRRHREPLERATANELVRLVPS